MAERNKPHIVVPAQAKSEPYSRPPQAIGSGELPAPTDRRSHGERLARELEAAQAEGDARRRQRESEAIKAAGIYVTFESFPNIELAFESLDPRQGQVHPELTSVRVVRSESGLMEQATVFIPDGKLGHFLSRINDYATSASAETIKHKNLVDRIASIGIASLEQLWTDEPELFPRPEDDVWWEVWLRRSDGQERDRLAAFAEGSEARLGAQTLAFADRLVVLVKARGEQLASALSVLDDLAELRRPCEPGELLTYEHPVEQAEWVTELSSRIVPAGPRAPAACILDSGVYPHPLFEGSLSSADSHACDPTWQTTDHDGHGTEMAGLALLGNVGEAILSGGAVQLSHRLESVKILPPPPGETPPELYGAITATASSLVEIQEPDRPRVFSVAVTADSHASGLLGDQFRGQPTSWSAAVDALAAGLEIQTGDGGLLYLNEEEIAHRRLFVVSAGNVDEFGDDHLDRSDVEPIEDPAQAWNALTVGAHTTLDDASQSHGFEGWTPVAPSGELSPHSRTGVAFARAWPHKPDVVLEGGNVARSPGGSDFDTPETMQLLTTKAPLNDQRLLTVTNATSAATSQAAHLAAEILADRPEMWPETVRALISHSAEWTPAMRSRFDGANTRAQRVALVRRYGMGVPDLLRATRSASDALTLIAEDVIRPFDDEGRMQEMNLHELPWPKEALARLGETQVRLRVTLSYFVEPNPSRRGWARRYAYASHGLRFSVRQPTESTDDFRKRVNDRARTEGERRNTVDSDAQEWYLGPDQRAAGSLHADFWIGTAADLSERGAVAVYPVSGWWKENKARNHSERGARYALVVSIETPTEQADIWSPVAAQVGVPISVQT